MKTKQLGRNGPVVSALGLGCMGMSEFYGSADEQESIRTIHRALDLGITLFDTADVYGMGENERLLGRALAGRRDKAFVATKFGIVRGSDPSSRGVSGKPEYVRACCEDSLTRLNIDTIDLYYQHRVDPSTPIEETVEAMAELVYEGKVRYLGLSEASRSTLERANSIFPIMALQTEYSIWSREPDTGLLDMCKQIGAGFVAYSPMGRGILTGKIRSVDDLTPDDFRRGSPRYQGENFEQNLRLVQRLEQMTNEKGCSLAQLALAWVMSRDDNIVPIFGTKRVSYLEENVKALDIKLSPEELNEIERISPSSEVAGDRYNEQLAAFIER